MNHFERTILEIEYRIDTYKNDDKLHDVIVELKHLLHFMRKLKDGK